MTAATSSTRPAYVLHYFRSLGAWTVAPEICGTVVLPAVGRSSLPAALAIVADLVADQDGATVTRVERRTAHLVDVFTSTNTEKDSH